jgi:hypothetical protein
MSENMTHILVPTSSVSSSRRHQGKRADVAVADDAADGTGTECELALRQNRDDGGDTAAAGEEGGRRRYEDGGVRRRGDEQKSREEEWRMDEEEEGDGDDGGGGENVKEGTE